MALLYIFAASGMEAQPVRKLSAPGAQDASLLRCGSNEIALFVGAMGPRNAKAKADAALAGGNGAGKPDAVLIVGLCGGLKPALPEQRIVVYSECLSTEAESRISCSQPIIASIIDSLRSAEIRCDRVIGITSSRIATTPAERKTLAGRTGAEVVDMESFAILQSAAKAGVPGAVLRVVADSSEWRLPDFNRALNDSGGLDGRKALGVALSSPFATIKLLSANGRAMRTLGKALESVLRENCFASSAR